MSDNMVIRTFKPEDSKPISDMLMAESIAQDQMDFFNNETWVYDDGSIRGFYTVKMEGIFPHVQHFCVDKNNRGGQVARALINHFKETFKMFNKKIISTPANNDFINKVVKRYFKVDEPYSVSKEHLFYLVGGENVNKS